MTYTPQPFIVAIEKSILIFSVILSGMVYADLSDGLVAYYPFNGGANDESGNDYHGTVYGAVLTQDISGAPDSAYFFDGDDWIETSLSDLSGEELSIAYWFKGSVLQSAVRYQVSTGTYVVSGWNGKHILSNNGGSSGGVSVGSDAMDGSWHHIAMTWKMNGDFVSYLDGTQVELIASGCAPIPVIAANVFLGSYKSTSEFTTGTLDEIRIYNRVLETAEVIELADFTITASLTPPAGPEDVASAMYTIEDITNYLDTGLKGSKRLVPFQEPSAGPEEDTGQTLDEIMESAPKTDNGNGALPSEVISEKTYWSLRTDGTWGLQTGSIPTQTLSSDSTVVPAGYYNETTLVDVNSNLIAENIGCGITIFGLTGTHGLPECVKKTGQVQCWYTNGDPRVCAGTGQDGEYELGCTPVTEPETDPESNLSLYSRRSFVYVDCIEAGFMDNGDGTVTDHLTGLIWLKDASCADLAYTDGNGSATWQSALYACNELANGVCGLSDGSQAGDWRLPNLNELLSLIDRTQSDPALPAGHAFTGVQSAGTQSGFYWSSTTSATATSWAWFVYFHNGRVYRYDKISIYYVWPVRDGQ